MGTTHTNTIVKYKHKHSSTSNSIRNVGTLPNLLLTAEFSKSQIAMCSDEDMISRAFISAIFLNTLAGQVESLVGKLSPF